MRSYLFVQWIRPTDPSRFVIDGKVSEYSGTELQDNIIQVFADVPNFKEICSNKNRNDLSPSFRLSYKKTKNSILNVVEGNFEETDFAGRKLVYIFATKETDSIKIVQILQEYAALLGKTPHHEDIEEIKQKEKIYKKKQINVLWIIMIIIATMTIFLLLFI